MKNSAIIVAGGTGTRMGTGIPKQFLLLDGKPLLMYSIAAFASALPDISIVVALHEGFIQTWKDLCRKNNFNLPHHIVPGGQTRYHSVKNALTEVPDEHMVGIHDAARPLISLPLIRKLYETACVLGNAIPVIAVNESLREIRGDQSIAANRSVFRIVQTPQVFVASTLKTAYDGLYDPAFTDDASVIEHAGGKIHLVTGETTNIKITFPSDLDYAWCFLKKTSPPV